MYSVMVHLLSKMSKLDATLLSVYMNNINSMGLRHSSNSQEDKLIYCQQYRHFWICRPYAIPGLTNNVPSI